MENIRTYRFISCLLAMLILMSTSGWAVDMHYCGGEFQHLSLLGEAKSCHELGGGTHCQKKKETKSCCSVKKMNEQCSLTQTEKDDCCKNETLLLDLDTDLKDAPAQEISLENIAFILVYVETFIGNAPDTKDTPCKFLNYKPPLLHRDIPVLIQSFLL